LEDSVQDFSRTLQDLLVKDGELPKEAALELNMLTALRDAEEPLGAVVLSLELQQKMEVSQATIGRKLKEFDMRGLTQRIGFRGRNLTTTGESHLQELLNSVEMSRQSEVLLRTVRLSDGEKLIQVLEARRALEKECARLATMRMKASDIGMLQEIVEKQRTAIEHGHSGSVENLEFHETIARLSQNDVLIEALRLVRSKSQLTLLVDTIRKKVGGVLVQDHQEIVEAMKARNPEQAEYAVAVHIDRLITDVRKYFEKEADNALPSDRASD
jgi:GntR family transcriptional regulator, transcriptional repressor for pyruvate dehydrogenase complex